MPKCAQLDQSEIARSLRPWRRKRCIGLKQQAAIVRWKFVGGIFTTNKPDTCAVMAVLVEHSLIRAKARVSTVPGLNANVTARIIGARVHN